MKLSLQAGNSRQTFKLSNEPLPPKVAIVNIAFSAFLPDLKSDINNDIVPFTKFLDTWKKNK